MNGGKNIFRMSAKNKRPEASVKQSVTVMRWLPLIAVEVYLNATILVFAWCSWPIDNPLILYSYVGTAHLLLALGYFFGVRRQPRDSNLIVPGIRWRQLLIAGILVTLVTSPLLIYNTTGGSLQIFNGIFKPGDTYLQARYDSQAGLGLNAMTYYIGQIRLLCGFLVMLVFPIGALFWNRLSFWLKAGVLSAVMAHIIESTSQGTNRGFADVVIITPWLLLLYNATRTISYLKRLRVVMLLVVTILSGLVFLSYFNENIDQRGNALTNIALYDMNGNRIITLEPFQNDELNQICGPIISYCTQGYYGLACSLNLPFVWTYGAGNSRIWTVYVEKYITGNHFISDNTYAERVEKDYRWNSYSEWHSIYPWLAGDVTFPGVIIIVFCTGMMLAITWREAIELKSYLAANVFILLILALAYFPANNQLMQVQETALGFYISIFLWWVGRSSARRDTKVKPRSI